MKVSAFLMSVWFFCLLAQPLYSQDTRVTVNRTDVSLETVLDDIEEQTAYMFIYKKGVNVAGTVTVNADNEHLSDLLSRLLPALRISYKVQGKHIILKKGPARLARKTSLHGLQEDLQNHVTVTGFVADADGQPLVGVSVRIKGTDRWTATDLNGNFMIEVPGSAMLELSSLGHETQRVFVSGGGEIKVVLAEEPQLIDEIIVVGYGTQRKASLTSSISNIRREELTATKQSDVVASLQGKVPGLLIRQKSGDAGDFNSDLSIRGFGEPIVVVDGIIKTAPRRNSQINILYSNSGSQVLAQMNPDDIESISVLKDASASLYGIGAENGVILVTTKQGKSGPPVLRYSNSLSFGHPTNLPDEVDILTWLNAANEMRANVGATPLYTQETINHYRNSDPGYTDNRWYSALFRDHSFQQDHNLSVNGGNSRTQYYFSASFNSDNGLLNGPDLGYNYASFQGNITSDLTKDLTMLYQSSVNWSHRVGLPWNSNLNLYQRGLKADRTTPFTAIDNPNHWAANPSSSGRNCLAVVSGAGGYDKTMMRSFTNSLNMNYKAPFLKGLSIKGQLSLDYSMRNTRQLTLSFPLYNAWTDELMDKNKDANEYSEEWKQASNLYGKLQADYSTKAKRHTVNAMLATEARLTWSENISASRQYGDFFTHDILDQGNPSTATNHGSRKEKATAGYLSRISYDYDDKYLAEVLARYDGSYIYASGHRWGFFPSYSLGWRISDEDFFRQVLPWISALKFRWSDGLTGGAQGTAYDYLLGFTQTGDSYVFEDGSQVMGYSNESVAETLISWTDVHMRDFGVDWEVGRGAIGGAVDWFWREIKGIQAKRTKTAPDMYGVSLPYQNLDASQNVGIDLELYHRRRIGDLNYRITATATFTRSRKTHIEAEKTAIYTSAKDYYDHHEEGRWSNALDGEYYEWNGGGQFSSWSEIFDYPVLYDHSSKHSNMSSMLPGMYKILDRNGDGVITSADIIYSWDDSNPPLQFGLMVFMDYRNMDFRAVFSGAALSHKNMSLSGGMGYGYNNTMFVTHLDHYTLADGYTDPRDPQSEWLPGYWPALATASGKDDTYSNATYRYAQPYTWVNNAYLRMKSIEIGYTLPEHLTAKARLESVRMSIGATNLLTFCNSIVKPWDPEANQGEYYGSLGAPLQKTVVAGISLTF